MLRVEKLERAEKAVYFAKRTCNRGHYRSAAQAKPEHSAEGQSKPGLAKKESVFLT
jgi:hypothetical protein